MFFSIRKKLVLIFLVIIIVPTTLSTSISMWLTLERLEHGLKEQTRRAMHDLKRELGHYESRSENIAELLAQSSEIKQFDHPDEIQEFLEAKRDLWYTAIVEVFDSQKKRIALSHTESGPVDAYLTQPTHSILDRGLELEKVSDYFLYPAGLSLKSMEPIVDMATLELIGIVVVTYPFNERLMQAFKSQIKSEVALQWNRLGDIVSTIQQFQGESLDVIWPSAITDMDLLDSIETRSDEMIAGKYYTASYEILKNQFGKTIGIFTTLVDKEVLIQNRKDTLQLLLVSVMVVFLTALVMGYLTARTFSRPILKLTRVARQLAQGQWEQTLPLERTDEIGVLARSFANMRDAIQRQIHDLTAMNRNIQKAEEKYRNIFENASEGIFQITPKGEIITINSSFVRILGYSSQEELHKMVKKSRAFFVDIDDLRRINTLLDRDGFFRNLETRFYRKNGKIINVSITAHTIKGADENIRYIEGNMQDITEQKRIEEYKKARDVAESANRAKSDFLAVMSHELRTPLNAIIGFSDILKRNSIICAEEKEAIEIIHKSGHHLLNLINQILNLSAIEAGQVTLNETDFDLHSMLYEIKAMLSLAAVEKEVRLLFDISEDIPRFVRSDQMKLRQIVINLVNNALKFTDRGVVTVSVTIIKNKYDKSETTKKNRNKIRIRFEVADTGIGILPEEMSNIFRPFTQASEGRGKNEGTGLGLTISEKFVQLLGGKIFVESTMGEGAKFYFDIACWVVHPDSVCTESGGDMARDKNITIPDGNDTIEGMNQGGHAIKEADASALQLNSISLSKALYQGMKDAVQRADMDLIDRMIDRVRKEDSALALTFQALADQFEYDRILSILEEGHYDE